MAIGDLLAVLLASSITLVFYSLYRQKADTLTAALISSIPALMLFETSGSPLNAIGFLCLGTGALFTLRGLERSSDTQLVIGGIFAGLAVLTNAIFISSLLFFWAAVFSFWRHHPLFYRGLLANVSAALCAFVAGVLLRRCSGAALWPEFHIHLFALGQLPMILITAAPWTVAAIYPLWFYLWRKYDVPWLLFALPAAWVLFFFAPLLAVPLVAVSGMPVLRRALRRNPQQFWSESVLWQMGICTVVAIVLGGVAAVPWPRGPRPDAGRRA